MTRGWYGRILISWLAVRREALGGIFRIAVESER